MKTTSTILIAGLLICGCSQKQAATQTDYIQAGQDIPLNSSRWVLRVDKRDGDSVTGIRFVMDAGKETESVLTADTGTLTTLSRKPDGQAVFMQLVMHGRDGQHRTIAFQQ